MTLSVLFITSILSATPEKIAYQLSTRYTPYADGASVLDVEVLAKHQTEVWWSTPEKLRENRSMHCPPLHGLHLAIDPGHIGGEWAAVEGRNFRIAEGDHWVREGELVLEVAKRVRDRLESFGAKVTLLRETNEAVNPKLPQSYWSMAAANLPAPTTPTLRAQIDHALAVRDEARRLAGATSELIERARVVNQVIQPDALISLHINAARWPKKDTFTLVKGDHAHALIFGCLSHKELASPRQQEQLIGKLTNGSGDIEHTLGAALASALGDATGLPASEYEGRNAIRIDAEEPYLWVRNLLLLRFVDCPIVLLEPYIANSETSYERIQRALALRAIHAPTDADDIIFEYTDAVVEGVLQAYGPRVEDMKKPAEQIADGL